MGGRLFVVSGPSGSGKSSIVRQLLRDTDLEFSVSATTRGRRPGEVEGVHYQFVSFGQFEDMVERGELLEWARYNNNYYGTPSAPVAEANREGRDLLLEIETQGARQVREKRPDAIMLFIAPPSMDVLADRLERRGDTDARDIDERLRIARAEMATARELFDHLIVNDDLDRAVDEARKLVTGG